MFFKGDDFAQRAIDASTHPEYVRSVLRRWYRLLRRHGIHPVIARSLIWDVYSKGADGMWHDLFNRRGHAA